MKLNKREKVYVSAGIIVASVLAVYALLIDPAIKRSLWLDKQIVKGKEDLIAIKNLQKKYVTQNKAIDEINKKLSSDRKNFAILSFLEDMADKAGIKNKIAKMKPSDSKVGEKYKESSVELKVEGITIKQLVDYLYRIENAEKVLNVKRLKLKKQTKSPQMLDVTFEVSTFELIKKS